MLNLLNLSELIDRAGLVENIQANNPKEAITSALKQLSLPEEPKIQIIENAILEREALMPTAVGYGIAIPHARNPIILKESEQRLGVVYLTEAVDFNALDHMKVKVLFIILAATPRSHLQILSQLSFLFHKESFREALFKFPKLEELKLLIEKTNTEEGYSK